MKFQELTTLLEQDGESIFISRDNDRQKRYQQILQRKIQNYIKNGSKGNLYLTHTPIKTLPDGLKVGGSLYLAYTSIQTLPAGLQVGGSLDLYNTPIKTLPDGLKVGGWLSLTNTPIKTLPDGLQVGGSLYLINTPIAKQYTSEQLKTMYPGVKGKILV